MNHYRFRYYWSTDKKALQTQAPESFFVWKKDIEASTPIAAIGQFHKFMQQIREVSPDRKSVLRPALKPDQYVVLSFNQYYHDASLHRDPSAQPIIESAIDYPGSANPDLSHLNRGGRDPFAAVGEVTKEFDFGADQTEDSCVQ